MYPWNPAADVDAKVTKVVPVGTLAVVVAGGALAPNQFKVQVPAWVRVPNGSVVVFEIAKPVSKPDWLVTNGKSRTVLQRTIDKTLFAEDVSAKRGIGNELEATAPAAAEKATGGVGA